MLQISSQEVPLQENEHGVLRVGDTRVSLDTVVAAFDQGETPEQIVENLPTLRLDDVYAVITYYLRNEQQVRSYLAGQRHESEALRAKIEGELPTTHLRERVRRRQRETGSA